LALKFFPLHRSDSGFVQSGFYEVALIPALRATPRNATSQNPPDSQNGAGLIQGGEPRRFAMSVPIPLRGVFKAYQLRRLAKKTKDGP
jgi:hypothetical protein